MDFCLLWVLFVVK